MSGYMMPASYVGIGTLIISRRVDHNTRKLSRTVVRRSEEERLQRSFLSGSNSLTPSVDA